MSLWDDHDVNMLWLDSTYPPTTAVPPPAGAARGPCSPTSGKPSDVEKDYPSSYVT
jgi:cellulose 1,4-beta-cellobiosidase